MQSDTHTAQTRAIILGAAAALLLCFSCKLSNNPDLSDVQFRQLQSSLTEYDGSALVMANFSGRIRPFLIRGDSYFPLIPQSLEPKLANRDLYHPAVIAGGRILFSSQTEGRRPFDLLVYDASAKTIIYDSNTPARDEGAFCVSPDRTLVSFNDDGRQGFLAVGGSMRRIQTRNTPGFQRCFWADNESVLGIVRGDTLKQGARYTLYHCRRNEAQGFVSCVPRKALRNMRSFTKFFRHGEGIGVIGLVRGYEYRRPFTFVASYERIGTPLIDNNIQGDILDYTAEGYRVGHESRYYYSGAPDSDKIVFSILNIGETTFGVAASAAHQRLAARLHNGRWNIIYPTEESLPKSPPPIKELWLTAPGSAERHQAFLFGIPDSKKLVVWLHGGPRENVSPRYNPYFHALNSLGFAVLALNYPGSTGRGLIYEEQTGAVSLIDSFNAVEHFIGEKRISVVVPWAASAGFGALRVWAGQEFDVSGVVVHSAAAAKSSRIGLRKSIGARGIPYYSIRGKYDQNPGAPVDFEFDGGHDISLPSQFEELFSNISPFLREVSSRKSGHG